MKTGATTTDCSLQNVTRTKQMQKKQLQLQLFNIHKHLKHAMMQRPKMAVEEDGVGLRQKTQMEVEVVQDLSIYLSIYLKSQD